MLKCATYEQMMSPVDSNELFSDGVHAWNLMDYALNVSHPIRSFEGNGKLKQKLESEGWKDGMPIPERSSPHTSGKEEIMIAIEAEDNKVYTGTATRYFKPRTFNTEDHKIVLKFRLGMDQEVLSLDNRMGRIGFDYKADGVNR